MEILLVRHGITAGNLRNAYIGVTDLPVCPQGLEALRRLPADETVTQVVVTSLQRTHQTAEILFPNAQQRVIAALSEMDFGAFEGKNYVDMEHDPDYRAWVDAQCLPCCPGGESMASFSQRVCDAFERLVDQSLAAGTHRLVLVVHGGVIMALASRFGLPSRVYYDWMTENGRTRRFLLSPAQWQAEKTMQYAPLED